MVQGRALAARILAVLATVAVLGALSAPAASAHSQLVSTSPVDGAVLDAAPAEVRITYDEPLLDDTDTISINDANGNVVFSAHPKPDGASVAIPWPTGTPAGTYQVAYRVVCGDGHPEVGAFSVTLTAAAAGTEASGTNASSTDAASTAADPSPAATLAAEQAPPAPGSPLLLIAGALVVAVAAGVLIAAIVTRRRASPSAT